MKAIVSLPRPQPSYRHDVGYEVRLDLSPLAAWTELPCHWIATYRTAAHGGKGNAQDREGMGWASRLACARRGARWVDLESDERGLNEKIEALRDLGTRVVLSHHILDAGDPFASLPPLDLNHIDVLKVIGTGSTTEDVCNQRLVYSDWQGPALVHFYMGAEFACTRWLSLVYGAPFTFVSLPGDAVAPGQLELDDVVGRDLPKSPRLFAIVGHPIGHSKSPKRHEPYLRALDSNALFLGMPVQQPRDFALLLEMFPELCGLAITKPAKGWAAAYANSVWHVSHPAGAINTAVRISDQWQVDNIDYAALLALLSEYPEEWRIRVLGYGGLGQVAVAAARALGRSVTVSNRTELEGVVGFVPWAERHDGPFEILVQATSCGMGNQDSPLDMIPASMKVLIESIYEPERTRLVDMATKQGCSVILGSTFFERQAALQEIRFRQVLD